ncbi:hypothetical protein [Mesotoga sp.]|uniref:hypothetical protein n=1 Tax=Mesotoga sp. TaxID=2053577 RepID=UPI00345EA421
MVYGVDESEYDLYPMLFVGKSAFTPSNLEPGALLESMENYSQEERESKLSEIDALSEDVGQRLTERYEQFGFLVVLGAGLIDGINPCAFVVLIFLVSYLYYVGREETRSSCRVSFLPSVFFCSLSLDGDGAPRSRGLHREYFQRFSSSYSIRLWQFSPECSQFSPSLISTG